MSFENFINYKLQKKIKNKLRFLWKRETRKFFNMKRNFICTYLSRRCEKCGRATFLRWITLSRMRGTSSRRSLIMTMLRITSCRMHKLQRFARLGIQSDLARIARNAGRRGVAFCFRKTFDSVEDHFTEHASSHASFHPVNAYVGQCFPSGVQGRPKFLLRCFPARDCNFFNA